MKSPPSTLSYERRKKLRRPVLHRLADGFEVQFPDPAYFRPRERWTPARITALATLGLAALGSAVATVALGSKAWSLCCLAAMLLPALAMFVVPIAPSAARRVTIRVDDKGLVVRGDSHGRTVVRRERLIDAWVDVTEVTSKGRIGYLALWTVSPKDLYARGGPHANAWERVRYTENWQRCLVGFRTVDLLRVLRLLREQIPLPQDPEQALRLSGEYLPDDEEVEQYVYQRYGPSGRYDVTGTPLRPHR